MRILYSHRIRSRDGQSVHLEAMVAALRRAGHEVLVQGPAGFAADGLGGGSGLVDWIRSRLPGWLGELAELAYAVPATWHLHRAAARFRPDAIYERENLFHLAGSLVARWRGLPLLLEVNAPLAEERAKFSGLSMRRLATALEHWVWRRASRVLPVTEVLAAHIAAAGVPRERISVVPNGIDLAEYPQPEPPMGRDAIRLGFIGFVRDWHGLDRVLRAVAAWEGQPPLSLTVVGDGPARPGLERLAAALGVADQLHFTGLAAREAVPGLIAGFDIAMQPAAVPYCCPLKALEYMAAGRAIVAPDQPNLRELLEHGRSALLFDPADPDAMWQAVLQLARDPALRVALGAEARADILRLGLTWDAHAARVVGFARQAMRPRRGGAAAEVARPPA